MLAHRASALVRGEPLVELAGVTAAYGRVEVLHGIDLTVPVGSVVGLIGPNGAGKSTLLRVVAGQLVPTAGHVHFAGRHVNGVGSAELARLGVALVPEGRAVFPNLTVAENLRVFTHTGATVARVEEVAYGRFPALAERRNQLAGTLSGGQQQMLALVRALATDPVLLVLDEISMGLGPMVVRELYDIVGALVADGTTVLAAEQFVHVLLELADNILVLQTGHVVLSGTGDELASSLPGAYLTGSLGADRDPRPKSLL